MQPRLLSVASLFLLVAAPAFADTFGTGVNKASIDFVTIRNPGNLSDDTGSLCPAGSVGYAYRMASMKSVGTRLRGQILAQPFRRSGQSGSESVAWRWCEFVFVQHSAGVELIHNCIASCCVTWRCNGRCNWNAVVSATIHASHSMGWRPYCVGRPHVVLAKDIVTPSDALGGPSDRCGAAVGCGRGASTGNDAGSALGRHRNT